MEDGHPILIVTASDIATVLRHNAINTCNVDEWLNAVDKHTERMNTYYSRLIKS